MAASPEFSRMYENDPAEIVGTFSSDFGIDIRRKRIARGHLPWLLRGGIGGNGGMDKNDVLFAVQCAWPFLTDGEKDTLGDLVHGVRVALAGQLDIGRLQELDSVARDMPVTLAKVVKIVPREMTGELYPRLEEILREGLVRYLFNQAVTEEIDEQPATDAPLGDPPQ